MKYGPKIRAKELPFEFVTDKTGTGILVEQGEDGFVSRICCIYRGVEDLAHFSHFGEYEARYTVDGLDYDFEHLQGTLGKVVLTPRGHESSMKSFDYEWSEWLEELFESFCDYRLADIRDETILRGFEYIEKANPTLAERVGDGLSHFWSFVSEPRDYMQSRQFSREFRKRHPQELHLFGMPKPLKKQIEMVLDKDGEDRETYAKFESFWQQQRDLYGI